jgi:VanZ family protein
MSATRLSPRWAVLSFGYMAFLYHLSSLPGSATGPNTPGWRLVSNLSHVPLFAGLAVCLALAFAAWPVSPRTIAMLAVGAAYAFFDEWHQSWVPGRSLSLLDVGLDFAGLLAVAGALLVRDRLRLLAMAGARR